MYTIIKDTIAEHNGRKRRVVRLIFNPKTFVTEDEERDYLVLMAREALNEDNTLSAVLIYAFSNDEAEKHQAYDRGRVVLTRDGLGWLGDGVVIIGTKDKDKLGVAYYKRNVNFIAERIPAPVGASRG